MKSLVVSFLSFVFCLISLASSAAAMQTDRAVDAAAIRAHIESIFQAFIDGDEEKIFAKHYRLAWLSRGSRGLSKLDDNHHGSVETCEQPKNFLLHRNDVQGSDFDVTL